ncbi:hypothetical protein [Rhizobium tumorigenes]|uniref:Uncharacterized protein n=1 Tax=Rhizobium tumorigenes TaxID=2041385 RepID=A0AAF1KT43_9HYPH|nr:hypothetical protein [Rhizobium tumorigenes]WFR98736.1 hypothetical protein PR017_23855 [Rhizobium tumorigenes]
MEMEFSYQLSELQDNYEEGTPAYGIIALLLANDCDTGILTPAQKHVFDTVIWRGLSKAQRTEEQERRDWLVNKED